MITTITQANFDKEVMQAEGKVLVDFWASWCGPCKMLSPLVDEVAAEGIPGLKVGKVNVDEEMELAQRFGVMTIPTLLLFENGKVVNQSVGFINKQQILALTK